MNAQPNPANPIQLRELRRGESLIPTGQRLTHVYLIQSGLISVTVPRDDQSIEICQLTAPQSFGEELLFGPATPGLTALALRDSKVFEIPVEYLKPFIAGLGADGTVLLKALFERLRATFGELKNERSNREITPCPGNHTAKVFGTLYHSARLTGRTEGKHECVAPWDELRRHAEEVFNEPVARLEQAVDILINLGYAGLSAPDAKGARELRLREMNQIEAFFDFFGTYHFKGGYGEFLKTNEKSTKVTQAFLEVAKAYEVDRAGNVHLPYKSAIDAMKKRLGPGFEADQLFRLEQKGLYLKRTTTQDGGSLSFYRPDWEQMLLTWRVLRQVELWNSKGYVELTGTAPATAGGAPVASADAGTEEQARAEREKWARRLAGWKPAAFRDTPIQLRQGKPRLGEVWCQVCMSVLAKNAELCEVCGANVPQKKPA